MYTVRYMLNGEMQKITGLSKHEKDSIVASLKENKTVEIKEEVE